jgi:hypothetical protein
MAAVNGGDNSLAAVRGAIIATKGGLGVLDFRVARALLSLQVGWLVVVVALALWYHDSFTIGTASENYRNLTHGALSSDQVGTRPSKEHEAKEQRI